MEKDKERSAKDLIEEYRTNLDTIIQAQASLAIVLRAKFDALRKVGFTEEQALEIVKARGVTP